CSPYLPPPVPRHDAAVDAPPLAQILQKAGRFLARVEGADPDAIVGPLARDLGLDDPGRKARLANASQEGIRLLPVREGSELHGEARRRLHGLRFGRPRFGLFRTLGLPRLGHLLLLRLRRLLLRRLPGRRSLALGRPRILLRQRLGEGQVHAQRGLGLLVEDLQRPSRLRLGRRGKALAHAHTQVEDHAQHDERADAERDHLPVGQDDPLMPRMAILHSPSSSARSIRSGAETPSKPSALAKTRFMQAIRYSLAADFSRSSEITFSPWRFPTS